MKKVVMVLALMLVLSGCGAEMTLETIRDDAEPGVTPAAREIVLELPDEAVLPAMENDTGVLYMTKDYDVSVETLAGGDMQKTIRTVTGKEPEDLTIIETVQDGLKRREFVWTGAGELGDQVGRAVVLDDGSFHYVISVYADADVAEQYQETWNGLFESISLS